MSPLVYIIYEVQHVNTVTGRQYEDFFVMLAEDQMRSKLLEYCSVNIHDAAAEINGEKSLCTYAYFPSPVLLVLNLV